MTNLTYWITYIDQFPDDTTIVHIPIGDLHRLIAQLHRYEQAIRWHHQETTATVPVGGHPRHDTALWETLKDTE